MTIEESLRRGVHEWFLVPDGVKKTIAVLEDAPYQPPASQWEAVPDAERAGLEADLRQKRISLRYRWARATMLMTSLNQMGTSAEHPLQKVAFEQFKEDFSAIRAQYKALAQDIPPAGQSMRNEAEQTIISSVDALLRRLYAYIAWGIRQQAKTDREVDQILEQLGFQIPVIEGRRLFDIVAPPIFIVALITMGCWLIVDSVDRWQGIPGTPSLHRSVVLALNSAIAAAIMYGWAAFIALKHRSAQIEQKVWQEGSAKCLIPIGFRAGLVTWAVIVVSTVIVQNGETIQSLAAMVRLDGSATLAGGGGGPPVPAWSFLLIRIFTAFPWILAGATASAILASCLGGDVRRTDTLRRAGDAVALGIGLGVASASAQLLQNALSHTLHGTEGTPFAYVQVAGLLGLACGAVLGFMVPQACRANLVTPNDPTMLRLLRKLLQQAVRALGTKEAAENWVFMPHPQLRGVTPAEAIQCEGYANFVRMLLDSEATREDEEARPMRTDRPLTVIDGGAAPIVPRPDSPAVGPAVAEVRTS